MATAVQSDETRRCIYTRLLYRPSFSLEYSFLRKDLFQTVSRF